MNTANTNLIDMTSIDDLIEEVNIETDVSEIKLGFRPVYDEDGFEVGMIAITQKHYGKFARVPMELFYEGRHLSPEAKWVYATLVSFKNNKTGKTFPSYESIMRRSGITRRQTISDALKELEHFGWITRRKKVGKSTSYSVGEPEKPLDDVKFKPLRPTEAEAAEWKVTKRRRNERWPEFISKKGDPQDSEVDGYEIQI